MASRSPLVSGARVVCAQRAQCVSFLLLLLLLASAFPAVTQAQEICYAAADGGNLLTQVNRNTGAETLIGGFGVSNIEAIAYSPGNGKLYAANAGQFGEVNTTTGAFSSIGSGFGTGNGALGSVSFSDVDGLHFDPVPGGLYGVHRRGNGNDGNNDVLFRISTATGAYVPGAFPDFNGDSQPDDYLVIYSGEAINRWDVDDLAIDPSNGKMYGAANNGSSNDELIEINRVDGSVTLVGNMGVFDIEGLGFDTNGELFGSSGTSGTPANSLFDINKGSGAATLIANLTVGTDYEGVACLTDGTNLISGTVFYDDDEDGVLDAGETGTSGITVRLFRDDNGNGIVDAGEPQIGTQSTNGVGYYEFPIAAAGDFVIMVLQGDLPANSTFTTDDVETASFPLGTFGGVDANNDFGYTTGAPPPGSMSITKQSNGIGPLPVGFTLTYTLTVTNTGGGDQTGIAVRDTLPPDVTYVPGSTQVTTPGGSFAGSPPPLLVTGQTLASGEQMTVTLQATINANPSTCVLLNRAWATSNESSQQNANRVDLIDSGTGCDLPVELTSFEVALDGRDALLSWKTASETNNAGFEIQRISKNDGASAPWQVLGFVNGYGTTEIAQAYDYRVEALEPGRHVFRLKQIDYDGSFEYHPEVEVFVEMAEQFVVEPAYPNPFNPEAQMRFAVNRQQAVQVVMYDVLGREVQVLYDGVASSGQMQVVRIDGSGLPSGLYLVRVVGESFVKTQTVTLLK